MSSNLIPQLIPFRIGGNEDSDDEEGSAHVIYANSEPFEIEDFTAASDWEKFIDDLENIIREWNISNESDSSSQSSESCQYGKWRTMEKTLVYLGFEFLVVRHTFMEKKQTNVDKVETKEEEHDEEHNVWKGFYRDAFEEVPRDEVKCPIPQCLIDLMDYEDEFKIAHHPINYYYGFKDYIVLQPNGNENVDTLTRIKMTLSTMTVAANNTRCPIPLFVQVMEPKKNHFCGIFTGPDHRTNFEMICHPRKPCRNKNDLMRMFTEKLSIPYPIRIDDCKASARKTFLLEDWTYHEWTQSPLDLELFTTFGPKLGSINDLRSFPLGSLKDPVKNLFLYTTWRNLPESYIVETSVGTDLEPLEAPEWSVSVDYEKTPSCLLNEYLSTYLNESLDKGTMHQILGNLATSTKNLEADDKIDQLPSALSRLTGPSYGLGDIIRSGRSDSQDNLAHDFVDRDIMVRVMYFLFPDTDPENNYPYPEEFASTANEKYSDAFGVGLSSIKSVPIDGIVWRFALILTHFVNLIDGIRSAAYLTFELFQEVRRRFEQNKLIPGLPKGNPDYSFCLLNQKFQMINCCIEVKLRREIDNRKEIPVAKKKSNEKIDKITETPSPQNESDEEFFDCDDQPSDKNEPKESPELEWEPEGRLKKVGATKLLNDSDYLYEPVCQEPPPMTEDQIAEYSEIMMQLGESSSGSELRTKMQSASLYSDMESFKAANPGSSLGDFVRWYSPRDWVEDSLGKGKLSTRMELPGNAWQTTWEAANPVPVRRQRRLFDDTKEAQRVFQYLNQLNPGQVLDMLTPTVLHIAVYTVIDYCDLNITEVNEIINQTIPFISQASKLLCRPEVSHYDLREISDFSRRLSLISNAAKGLEQCEIKMSQALSLRTKFLKEAELVKEDCFPKEDHENVTDHMENFISDLYNNKVTKVVGGSRGPAGQLIVKMFREAKKASQTLEDCEKDPFPYPYSREYIIRALVRRPYYYSRQCPQKLYCLMKENEFRLASAITDDKLYM